jgi:alkanesulfonate monooxygenase SsuD/methylene tetrahydromethanopterin reductase-like flavin-dependent oxidoreductase (luciferase family)
MMPKPGGGAGVPVWIGGRAIPAVARRVAAHGTGWIPWGVTAADFGAALARMRSLVEAEGRDFASVRVSYAIRNIPAEGGGLDLAAMFEPVPALGRLGVSDFRTMVRLPEDYRSARDVLTELRERFDAGRGDASS